LEAFGKAPGKGGGHDGDYLNPATFNLEPVLPAIASYPPAMWSHSLFRKLVRPCPFFAFLAIKKHDVSSDFYLSPQNRGWTQPEKYS
jgi:hypothetical protein